MHLPRFSVTSHLKSGFPCPILADRIVSATHRRSYMNFIYDPGPRDLGLVMWRLLPLVKIEAEAA